MPFSFLVVVFENTGGQPADGETALDYWAGMGEPDLAVLGDGGHQVIELTPWEGQYLPGKCAFTPEMEILGCYTGHGNAEPFAAILEHAASSGG